jgi:hypothetical protein
MIAIFLRLFITVYFHWDNLCGVPVPVNWSIYGMSARKVHVLPDLSNVFNEKQQDKSRGYVCFVAANGGK